MKRLLITLVVLTIALTSLSIVGAQGPDGNNPAGPGGGQGQRGGFRPDGELVDIIADALGLTPQEILALLREGDMTLEQIITDNGGDVEALRAELTAVITENINERATEQVGSVEQLVDRLLTEPMGMLQNRDGNGGVPRSGEALSDAVMEAAGLDPDAMREQLEAGATLGEIATAAGLDPNAIIATVIAAETERTNEAVANGRVTQAEADQRLANLETRLTEYMNTSAADARLRTEVSRAVLKAVGDTLDIRPRELAEQLTDGQTLADFITANSGDVAAISAAALTNVQANVEQAVTRGRLTQAQADEVLAGAEAQIAEMMNTAIERPLPR